MTRDRSDELVPLEGEQLRIVDSGDGGGARNVAQERDLAERLAGPGIADLLAVDRDLDASVLDDVEEVAGVALPEDDITLADGDRDQLRSEILDRRRRQRREDRVRAQQLDPF